MLDTLNGESQLKSSDLISSLIIDSLIVSSTKSKLGHPYFNKKHYDQTLPLNYCKYIKLNN